MTEPVTDTTTAPAVVRSRFALPPADDPNRRLVIIGLIGAAVLLLLFVGTRLLGGGGGGEEEAAPPPPPPPPPATTVVTTPGPLVESFDVFRTKNPFAPLIGAPIGTATPPATGSGSTPVPGSTGAGVGAFTGRATTTTTQGSGTGTGTGSGGTGSGGTGTGTGTGSGSGGTTGTTTRRAQGNTEPRQQQRVALLDVFTEGGRVTANVRVNSTVYKVRSGETFAGSYRVVSLSSSERCGRFVFGDDQFRLCEGEETLK